MKSKNKDIEMDSLKNINLIYAMYYDDLQDYGYILDGEFTDNDLKIVKFLGYSIVKLDKFSLDDLYSKFPNSIDKIKNGKILFRIIYEKDNFYRGDYKYIVKPYNVSGSNDYEKNPEDINCEKLTGKDSRDEIFILNVWAEDVNSAKKIAKEEMFRITKHASVS